MSTGCEWDRLIVRQIRLPGTGRNLCLIDRTGRIRDEGKLTIAASALIQPGKNVDLQNKSIRNDIPTV